MFVKTWASVFRLLKKSCWASSVSQNVPVSLGSVCALAITEGRGTIAGIWPYFITSHFGKAQSLFFWYYHGQFLTAEESTYCQRESSYITFLCLKNDLAVSRGCLKLPDRSLGSTGDTVHGDKLLCYCDGAKCYLSFLHSGQSCVSLGQTVGFWYCWWENSFLQTSFSVFLTEKTVPLAQPAGC